MKRYSNMSKLLRVSQHNSKIFQTSIFQSSSRRLTRIFLMTLAVIAFSASMPMKTVWAESGVRFDHTEFNFGQIPVGALGSHTFWIHAVGADTIVIDTVITGCGCTTIPLETKVLAPSDSVAFEIVFDSKGILGSVAKRPGFKVKDDTTLYDVKFYASVISSDTEFFPISILPPLFPINEDKARSGIDFPFTLSNLSDEDITVRVVDFPRAIFEIELAEAIPAKGSITGHFKMLAGYPLGENISKSMTFEVNNSQLFRLSAPIIMKATSKAPEEAK